MSKTWGGAMLAGLLGVVGLRDVVREPDAQIGRESIVAMPCGVFRATAYRLDAQTLILEFHNGYAYRYHDVPPSVYADFLQSANPGTFYNERIRRRYAMERAPDRCLTRPAKK